MDPSPRFYRPAEIMERLSISKATFFRQVAAGKIRVVKIGRATRVPAESLSDYIARLPAGR